MFLSNMTGWSVIYHDTICLFTVSRYKGDSLDLVIWTGTARCSKMQQWIDENGQG